MDLPANATARKVSYVISPSIPGNEKKRLGALQALNILDTPPEPCFDRITRYAIDEFGVSAAGISFLDAERQWFKSSIGLAFTQTPRDLSFCGYTILDERCFVVLDAAQDPRFFDNPFVANEPRIKFYAGAPLHSPNSHRIGSLCVINDLPMLFSAEKFSRLRELAYMVDQEIEDKYHS